MGSVDDASKHAVQSSGRFKNLNNVRGHWLQCERCMLDSYSSIVAVGRPGLVSPCAWLVSPCARR